ncbi:DUF2061 domain-containing protein [Sphingobium baderi]|uniref:DUF2061 domain-containing protein n=1 Tax=Sphingobium baderi LL03 TaxID=1114964 RepID=T0GM27_9SPHN|nr:DUF2061 domain-containing protein [Sphingobium baderi]EQB01732.1 hypothetical protein L485_09955 [Sphingobium baderi LL03]KMS62370.1 hypothetical protein V475_08515 [Sphingobium baderi LL03]WRD76480.1 DUF2061 domain-containing protein [Sphingobium baderi]
MLLFRGKESNPRSLVKAISWRTLGSIDTFFLGLLFTQNMKAAGAIASTEVITKILLYYFHERAWAQIGWGLPNMTPGEHMEDVAHDQDSAAI